MIRIQIIGRSEKRPKSWFRAAELENFTEAVELPIEQAAEGMACVQWSLPVYGRSPKGINLFIVVRRGMPAIQEKVLDHLKIVEVHEMHIQLVSE